MTGMSDTKVIVVFGPPGSGKSTYVKEQMREGDLVVDFDSLFQAVSGLPAYHKPACLRPFVAEARDALIDRILRPNDVRAAWIITSEPNRRNRQRLKGKFPDPEFVELEVGASECLRRIGSDPRRSDQVNRWTEVLTDWFKKYEPELD